MFLTPNRRLALFLKEEQGKQAYPFRVWTESLWEVVQEAVQHDPTQRLLSMVEQWVVWEKIIKEGSSEYPLLRSIETAKRVAEGWHLCQHWGISFAELSKACVREDHEFFLRWIKQYIEQCQVNRWVDTTNFLEVLQGELLNCSKLLSDRSKDCTPIPQTISCIGFNEWTPQEQKFLEYCSQAGSTVRHGSLLRGRGQTFRYAAPTESEELISAIQGAKRWLTEHPTARIGILIPNLEQRRFEVERLLSETFLVEQFNISAPLPLSEYPLIQAAFLGLSLGKKDIKFEDLSKLLRLPFYGKYEQEMHHCSALEVLLREKINQKGILTDTLPLKAAIVMLEQLQVQLPALKSELKSEFKSEFKSELKSELKSEFKSELKFGLEPSLENKNPVHFIELLKACSALQTRFLSKQSSENWKTLCLQLLNLLNWPGDRSLDVQEQELQKHWLEVLEQYQSMGRVLGKHSYSEALTQIKRLAAAKSFLPLNSASISSIETSSIGTSSLRTSSLRTSSIPASIQVLGLLEGLGIPFDFLWVMGLNRKDWPKEPAPNPFIPLPLQRAYNLPRSHAARELQVAKRLTEQLCWGAKTVVFSYAMMIEDQKTTLSPLLGELAEIKFSSQNDQFDLLPTVIPAAPLHFVIPAEAGIQSVPVQDNEIIRGGSRILKLQAACPFRAFADIRLHAKPLQPLHFGLSPALRGEMLHQVLLFFWEGLSSQAALKALTDMERLQRIELSIDKTLQKHRNFWDLLSATEFVDKYITLERRRLRELAQRFIELELSRPPFEVIAREVKQEVMLKGLLLTLRIDRIDRLLDKEDEILIDYKTGKTQLADWFGERPLDPQLPLYCIARKPKASGVAFAIIRPESVKYQGLSAIEDCIEGIKTPEKMLRYGSEETWESQCLAWEQRLEDLAFEFSKGRVEVLPLEGEKTCRGCDYKSLCRVDELNKRINSIDIESLESESIEIEI